MLTTRDVKSFIQENNIPKGAFARSMDMHPSYFAAIMGGRTSFTERSQEKVREAMKTFTANKEKPKETATTKTANAKETTKVRRTRKTAKRATTATATTSPNKETATTKDQDPRFRVLEEMVRVLGEIFGSNLSTQTKMDLLASMLR